jgi:hypothetical protein
MGLYVGMDLHSTNCYTGCDSDSRPNKRLIYSMIYRLLQYFPIFLGYKRHDADAK